MEYHRENWTINYNSQTVKIRKLYHIQLLSLKFVKCNDIHMIYSFLSNIISTLVYHGISQRKLDCKL